MITRRNHFLYKQYYQILLIYIPIFFNIKEIHLDGKKYILRRVWMFNKEEEIKMTVLEAYKEAVTDAETNSLQSAINDLRELGDLLEERDPHFFEE
jgi:hypothetical protein